MGRFIALSTAQVGASQEVMAARWSSRALHTNNPGVAGVWELTRPRTRVLPNNDGPGWTGVRSTVTPANERPIPVKATVAAAVSLIASSARRDLLGRR